MTISTETYRVEYAGNGSTAAFSTSFAFFDNDDVIVLLRVDSTGAETTWTEGTQYTLTGANTGAAGTITVDTSPTDYTPASGTTLIIYRDPAVTQPTSFPLGGDFPSTSAENALDRIVMLIQKVSGDVDGALHYPSTDGDSLSAELPNSVDRASMFLAFDADGEPVAAAGTSADLGPVTAFINTLLDDADAATARATLGAGTVDPAAANTFTAAQTVTLATAGNNITLKTTDAGATGSTLRLYHAGGSQADADIVSTVLFDGQDDAGTPNDQTYAKLTVTATDSGNGSEDGTVTLFTPVAGTLAARLALGAGLYTATATGTDKGAGTINATQFYDDGVALKNGIVQVVETATGAVSTGTTTTPYDDTIPQIGEGTQFLSRAITPTSASNKLLIEINVNIAVTANVPIVALFQDAGANAVYAFAAQLATANVMDSCLGSYMMTAGTTSATTFTVRIGCSSVGTITFNGSSSGRLFGGMAISSLRITELAPQQ